MDTYLSVRDFAQIANRSEETIKRYIRVGKLPNAIKESDKKGWRIPKSDLNYILPLKQSPAVQSSLTTQSTFTLDESNKQETNQGTMELVNLAYQAVTMTSPTEELLEILSYVGIHRTLEILLAMQQSPTKVKNPSAFIKKAISKGWTPTTIPIKKEHNVSRIQRINVDDLNHNRELPFYNWLED
jgi:hypothetical protein